MRFHKGYICAAAAVLVLSLIGAGTLALVVLLGTVGWFLYSNRDALKSGREGRQDATEPDPRHPSMQGRVRARGARKTKPTNPHVAWMDEAWYKILGKANKKENISQVTVTFEAKITEVTYTKGVITVVAAPRDAVEICYTTADGTELETGDKEDRWSGSFGTRNWLENEVLNYLTMLEQAKTAEATIGWRETRYPDGTTLEGALTIGGQSYGIWAIKDASRS